MAALNITPDGKHSKKPYDLTSRSTDHCKGGMITVVGVRDTVPDSDYNLGVDAYTKTMLCNTANFAHMKENYYFVHVPLGLLSRNAYQMLVQREQSYSAMPMDITQFPVFNLFEVVQTCIFYGSLPFDLLPSKYMDVHGFNICANAIRLLDQLGYGYYGDILMYYRDNIANYLKDHPTATLAELLTRYIGSDDVPTSGLLYKFLKGKLNGLYPSVARIGAYQCVWYNFFRNDIYDCDVDASCYNFDDVTYKTGGSVNYDVTAVGNRGVDNFIINCLQMRYNPNKKDIFMSSMPGTQFGAASTVSLMDNVLLTINIPSSTSGSASYSDAAVSSVSGVGGAGSYGGVRVLPPDSGSGEYGRLVTDYAPEMGTGQMLLDTPHTHLVSGGTTTSTLTGGTSLFDVLSLVESQAIQKWRQKSMLAGNKTVDQFRAHHGVVPRHLIDHLPDFIGSVDNEIMIKEITSQANTLDASEGQNNLGEIRGRGYSVSDNKMFRFHSDDYGVLLLLHAIVPENTYSSYGMDKGNMMVYYSDFFQQEYENIGLEAVPKILLNTLARYPFPELAHERGQEDFADALDEGCIGYAPRNYGYKQYPSKVHGLFNPSRIEEFEDGALQPYSDIFGYSDLQSFVLPRTDMVGMAKVVTVDPDNRYPTLTMSLSKLYVNPSLFDSIFAFKADDWLDSDPFFTDATFICQAMLPMTVTGLPQF